MTEFLIAATLFCTPPNGVTKDYELLGRHKEIQRCALKILKDCSGVAGVGAGQVDALIKCLEEHIND